MRSKVKSHILLARFLTKSGDQAWDFAVPITLLTLFPHQLNLTATYYLLVRMAQVFLTPHFSSFIDRASRLTTVRVGIGLQTLSSILEFLMIYFLWKICPTEQFQWNPQTMSLFLCLVTAGIGSSLGAVLMNISVANDIVPSLFSKSKPESESESGSKTDGHWELAQFNGQLKQVDLFTEVSAPILAGCILTLRNDSFPLLGFFLVIVWNSLSFLPEYLLLLRVFKLRPDLLKMEMKMLTSYKKTFSEKFLGGWRSFFGQPVAAACFCYALLWLSVLSPHGVLLSAFLKGGWKLSEPSIGIFRGLGALFGLASTIIFPKVLKKLGLIKSGRMFIQFQSFMVILALISFYLEFKMGFLLFILFSRIGLYGFSLGETQIRQEGIPENVRGEINGFAGALTSVATIILYFFGAMLPSVESFRILVEFSVIIVSIAALIFTIWSTRFNLTVKVGKESGR